MDVGLAGRAAGVFAATNIDDILVLSVYFGQAGRRRGAATRVVVGQYLGFLAILAAAVVGALGAGLLPARVLPYLGLLPLLLGLRAAWTVWREHRAPPATDDRTAEGHEDGPGPGVLTVAGVTFANGGDNIGVYVPVLATVGVAGRITFCAVFLLLVGVWCGAGRFLATRAPVAGALSRWGHIVLPVVLIGIGVVVLVGGAA